MRIGVLLRHLDQHGGGVVVYTRGLLEELFEVGREHEFVLIYQNPGQLGRYASGDRIREVAVPARTRMRWDQYAAPRAARREGVDLLFNPKYSLPLASGRPGVFVCHGLDWYVVPRWSTWGDRLSHRYLLPLYARKARRIIAVSETVRQHLQDFLEVPLAKIDTVPLGIDEALRRPVSEAALAAARRRYRLPRRYLLYCGQIYPPKNFGRLVEAYAQLAPSCDVDLVVAGAHTFRSEHEIATVARLGLSERVRFLGWVEHADLPPLYRQAEALVMPSLYEAWPSPPLEAMACECPVVTADRFGTLEVAGDAARLVDPTDVHSIADGIREVLEDRKLRERLVRAGLRRQAGFTWRRCAEGTLASLLRAGADQLAP